MRNSIGDVGCNFLPFIFAGVLILLLASPSMAANFCVGTPTELQTALTIAQTNNQNDLIYIQRGSYNGNFVYTSTETHGITIEGGYNSGCTEKIIDPAETSLDGGTNGPVLSIISTGSASFLVDNLTLKNGSVSTHGGGGLYIKAELGEFTITNNIISDNYSSHSDGGGGVYLYHAGMLNFSNNFIKRNSGYRGGGLMIEGTRGTVNLNNNNFDTNSCQFEGGGLRIDGSGTDVVLTKNIFHNNEATYGGGVSIYSCEKVFAESNYVSNNNAKLDGGMGIHSSREIIIVNNLIHHNSAYGVRGGGLCFSAFDGGGSITLCNNTVAYNTAKDQGGGIWIHLNDDNATANVYNNIVLFNEAELGDDLYFLNDWDANYVSSITNFYNNNFDQNSGGTYIQLPFTIDPSNLNNSVPLFVDPENDDFHLQAASPCINTGNNTALNIPIIDKDGYPRIMDGIVDMGAYEYPGAAIPIIDSFNGSPTTGEVPLAVTFNCIAHDYNGTIDSYSLDFGDGSSQNNSTGLFNYDYVTAGTYEVTCTAVDNDGESNISEPIIITVTSYSNKPPVADCGKERVVVFDEVTLDGSASYDPDGTINTYEWSLNHEDGSKISAFGSNPTISKLPSGFYDVTLTVTDDGGLVHTDNMLLAAAGSCFCTPSKMHIESITAGINKNKYGKVTVTVFDDCGNPIPGAEVTGTFSGDFNGTGTGVTDANGVAVIVTTASVSKPSYTFCVDNVVKGALTYEPNDNVETCESN